MQAVRRLADRLLVEATESDGAAAQLGEIAFSVEDEKRTVDVGGDRTAAITLRTVQARRPGSGRAIYKLTAVLPEATLTEASDDAH